MVSILTGGFILPYSTLIWARQLAYSSCSLMGSTRSNQYSISSSTQMVQISVIARSTLFQSIGMPATVVSMSMVVRRASPIMEDMVSPLFRTNTFE